MSPDPAVTISLVTWNGRRWLPGCLDSVAAQTLEDYELLILDNGSRDGSVEWLRERAAADPRITLVESAENLGYARGHNRNIEAARGEAVLLLNQDIELDPGFLATAAAVLEERPEVGSVQARLRRLSAPGKRTEVIDTTGLEMHRDRRVVSRGQLETDDDQWAVAGPLWGADGAAPVYRRAALDGARLPRSRGGAEVLDEDFFSYKEDVDLAWRLQRLGWSAWYEPAALAWHARGSGDTGASSWRAVVRANMANPPGVRALSWRNHRLMQVKNEETGAFLRDLPWIARREAMAWAFMLLADPRRLTAVPALVRGLPAAVRKRQALSRRVRLVKAAGQTDRGASRSARALSRLRVSGISRALAHLKRRGPAATARRVREELRERWWKATQESSTGPPVREVRSRAISARLDRPRFDAFEGSEHLSLLGWAHSSHGIERIDVYVDGQPSGSASIGRARPDVASSWRHLDQTGIEGFSAVLPLAPRPLGYRRVSVAILDRAGAVRVLTKRFRRIDAAETYQRFHPVAGSSVPVRRGEGSSHAGRSARGARVVVSGSQGGDLEATLRSVASQRDCDWDCVVLSVGTDHQAIETMATAVFADRDRERWSVTAEPGHLLPNEVDPARLVAFLHAGELLAPSALRDFMAAAASRSVRVVYSDHDAVDASGRRIEPWFVPDWSPYRSLAQDYVGGVFMARDGHGLRAAIASRSEQIGLGEWRYALLLELTHDTDGVEHVPRVLWARPTSSVPDGDAAMAVVEAELKRRGVTGAVVATSDRASGPVRRITWPRPVEEPLVSIIVPTTGRPELVDGLLTMLHESTDWARKEIVVLDNSRGRHPDGIDALREAGVLLVERDEPFNWARLNNVGATHAAGDLLLFLNDDIQATDSGWLERLVRLAVRPDVGAVGPMLTYPDGTIQEAGVFLVGHGGGAAHLLQGLEPGDTLYLDHQHVEREVSAVTGACLLVPRDVFEQAGGFDEQFTVAGNDVDLCLRITAAGRHVIWTPASELIHEEGRSRRGVDYLGDETRFWERWGYRLKSGDPFLNPNLSDDRVDLALDWSLLED